MPPAPKPPDAPVALAATDLVFPEGFEKDDALITEFLGVVNHKDMTPKDRANALVALQAKVIKTASEKGSQLWTEQQTAWQNEARADKEIGGEKLTENLTNISRLIDAFGGSGDPANPAAPRDTAKLKEVFSLTGAGNHPEMIRFLSNIARTLVAEGKLLPTGQPANVPRDAGSILYDGKK